MEAGDPGIPKIIEVLEKEERYIGKGARTKCCVLHPRLAGQMANGADKLMQALKLMQILYNFFFDFFLII